MLLGGVLAFIFGYLYKIQQNNKSARQRRTVIFLGGITLAVSTLYWILGGIDMFIFYESPIFTLLTYPLMCIRCVFGPIGWEGDYVPFAVWLGQITLTRACIDVTSFYLFIGLLITTSTVIGGTLGYVIPALRTIQQYPPYKRQVPRSQAF